HQLGVELDAKPARAVFTRRGNDDAPVARAEIRHEVARARAGELQHALDDFSGRGDEWDAPVGLVGMRESGPGEKEGQEDAQRGNSNAKKSPACGRASCLSLQS